MQWKKNSYWISDDYHDIDLDMVYEFLSQTAYWCKGMPRDTFIRSAKNSICFSLYDGKQQIGYARVISDKATIAYLGDVFILEGYRGQGLSKWLMQVISEHSELQQLRRWILLTGDAHGLYKQYGFTSLPDAELYMEKFDPKVYQ